MMSTAILMSMGAEQSAKRPVAQEVEKLDGPTFAQALDARVGVSSETVGKHPAAGASPELGDTKTEAARKNLLGVPELTAGTKARLDAPEGTSAAIGEKDPAAGTPPARTESTAKNLIDVPELTAGAKARISVGQTAPNGSVSKEIVAGKSNPSETVTTIKPKVSGKTEDSGTQVAEPSGNTEEITAEALTSLPVASTSGTETGEAKPAVGQGDENLILETSLPSKGIAATGTAPETASAAKKTIKTQGSDVTPTVATKSGTTAVHATTDETKPAQGVVVEVPTALASQTVAYVAPVLAPTISRNAESDGGVSGATLITGASSTADGSSHKNVAQSAKTPGSNIETTPAVLGDSTGTAKIDAKAERSPAVVANAVGDRDAKGRTAGEPPVTSFHPLASGIDLTSGAGPSGVTGLVKLPNGESGAQTAGLPSGLREQDGSGAVVRSFEPVPRTLSATPTALEVGIPDGTHGWLKVRAEITDGGVVNASVSASSAASQEMLHRELPSLTAYLQSEKVAVNSVVVHPTAGTGTESLGYSAGTDSGASGQTPQGSHEGGEQRQNSVNAAMEATENVSSYRDLRDVGTDGTLPLTAYEGGGSWLSVRA